MTGKKPEPAATKRASGSPRSKSNATKTNVSVKTIAAAIVEAKKIEEAETDPATEGRATAAEISQINEIIKNARATWFALLGALVFAAVTLAGVKDVAFFVTDVETKLPLAGISVPIRSFFWAGALLIAALYIYFHLYLEQLWQALGRANGRIGNDSSDTPLSDHLHPWLVSDTALRFRDWLRSEQEFSKRSSRVRSMWLVTHFVSFGLVWVFGLFVIIWFWWRSMPAHDVWLTRWLGLILIVTIWVSATSFLAHYRSLVGDRNIQYWPVVRTAGFLSMLPLLFVLGELRTGNARLNPGGMLLIASAQLAEVEFTKRPTGWFGKPSMKRKFRVSWCKQKQKNRVPLRSK